jgi:hypothetical protein
MSSRFRTKYYCLLPISINFQKIGVLILIRTNTSFTLYEPFRVSPDRWFASFLTYVIEACLKKYCCVFEILKFYWELLPTKSTILPVSKFYVHVLLIKKPAQMNVWLIYTYCLWWNFSINFWTNSNILCMYKGTFCAPIPKRLCRSILAWLCCAHFVV